MKPAVTDCRPIGPGYILAPDPSFPRRDFVEVRKDNPNDSNLTNLNVVKDTDRLYVMHSDWLAHLTRYSYLTWLLTHRMKGNARVLDVGSARLEALQFVYRNRGALADYTALDLRATKGWLGEEWLKSPSVPPVTLVRMDVVEDPIPTTCWERSAISPSDAMPPGIPWGWDVVVCLETLEHVPRDKAPTLVGNLFHWTRPGGTCLLSSPNAGASTSTAENHVGPDGVSREHTYQEKVELTEAAGFELADSFGTFIRLDNLPDSVKTTDVFHSAHRYLKGGWLNVAFAADFPDRANNSILVLKRPE